LKALNVFISETPEDGHESGPSRFVFLERKGIYSIFRISLVVFGNSWESILGCVCFVTEQDPGTKTIPMFLWPVQLYIREHMLRCCVSTTYCRSKR
jgi:hypothetical protein